MDFTRFIFDWYGWASPVGLGLLLAGVGVFFWGQHLAKRKV